MKKTTSINGVIPKIVTAREESRWKKSFRRNEIAPRLSHRDPDRCDARYETARRLGSYDWPNATTSKRNPSTERWRSQRPSRVAAASLTNRCGARAPTSPPRAGLAAWPGERWQNRE